MNGDDSLNWRSEAEATVEQLAEKVRQDNPGMKVVVKGTQMHCSYPTDKPIRKISPNRRELFLRNMKKLNHA